MEIASVVVFVGTLVFLAHAFAAIFSRTRIPDVLLLIVIGLALGPVLGWVRPASFGAVGPVFTSITLVIILFESGIGLRWESLRKAFSGAFALTAVNFGVTLGVVGLLSWQWLELTPLAAFLLGAIVGGTSSAVVIPLVRHLKLQEESSTVLVLESAVSDVLCIVVALGFLQAARLGELRFGLMAGQMISSFFLAATFGVLGGFAWSVLLSKVRTLENALFTTPAFVFILFGVVELLGYSGAIASLAFGITLGNAALFKLPVVRRYLSARPIALNETEKVFFSEVAFLVKTFFFVYIGLSIQLAELGLVSAGLLLTLLLFLLRIPVVRFSVQRSTPASDCALMAAMVPKGLAAAVLASLPLQQGLPGGERIQNLTYAVVLFSIVLTSLLVFLLEKTPLSKLYESAFATFGQQGPAPAVDAGGKPGD